MTKTLSNEPGSEKTLLNAAPTTESTPSGNVAPSGNVVYDTVTSTNIVTDQLTVSGVSTSTISGLPRAYLKTAVDGSVDIGLSSANFNVSITATGAVRASQFVATCDARTKDAINSVDTKRLANAIREVPVKTWQYKDLTKGRERLGFVAQDVRDAGLSWAVGTVADFLPNVYRRAESLGRGAYRLEGHGISKGDAVRYHVFETEDAFRKDPCVSRVIGVEDDVFVIDRIHDADIFVYGTWSEDIMSVDYGALTAVSFAAIQEMQKTIDDLREQIAQIEKL